MARQIIFLFSIISLLTSIQLNGQTTYSDFSSFKDAVVSAKAGDEIILADGTYTPSSITMQAIKGTAEQPIIIRAESVGGVILNDNTYIDLRTCEYVTFQGFVINISEKSTTFKLQASNNIRLTQNVFDGSGESYFKDNGTDRNSAVWISVQGQWDDEVTLSHHNRIDHNVFQNKQTLGNMIRIDGTNETQVSQYDVIDYNHFKNMGPRAENEMEVIRIGWSAMSESDGFCTVSNNLFEECNGDPEIISVKCNKNTLSHNTFRRCQGTLSLRHGNASLVEGNYFLGEGAEGTGGVRIYGSDHIIINNHFEGLTGTRWDAPITLTEGDAEEGSGSLSKHFRIERAIIANNTLVNNSYGVEVGYDNSGSYSKPPRDVVLAYNIISGSTNALVNYINQPDNMRWENNILYATGSAITGEGVSFSESQVVLQDPQLIFNTEQQIYKATETTPAYVPSIEVAGNILLDIEGQSRTSPTNYGADQYSTDPGSYYPLLAKHVGPSQGEFLFTNTSALNISVHGGTASIQISSNLDWKATTDASWLSLNALTGSSDGSLDITVETNTTGLIRSSKVTIESTNISTGENIVEEIIITQSDKDPPALEISHSELMLDATASNTEITIFSNLEWTITSDMDWISSYPSSGNDTSIVAISVTANTALTKRSGTVTISDGATMSKTISVTQEGSVGTEIKLGIISAVASTEQNEEGKYNVAANTIDGLFTNRWSGEGDGAFITLDLGEIQQVSFLKVGVYNSSSRGTLFDILVSKDSITFEEALMDITSEITDEQLILYDFDNVDARYVRVVGHGNTSGSLWNSFTEFEVWGWESGTSSIQNANHFRSVSIYPNPCDGRFQLAGIDSGELAILSLDGKTMYQTQILANSFYQPKLKKGIYILSIQKDGTQFTGKLIIR